MLWQLFLTFFKIGLFTFGGGYAMIAQMKEVVVEKKRWLCEDELMQVIVIAESTPGPIAINLATYVGYKKRGVLGAAMATLGVIVPSLCIIFAISLFLEPFMQNQYVRYAFVGIKCAVAFLILKAGLQMLSKLAKNKIALICFGAVLVMLLLLELFAKSVSSILLILVGGLLGVCGYALRQMRTSADTGKGAQK